MSFGASPVTQRGTLGEELKRKDWGIEEGGIYIPNRRTFLE